MIASVRDESRLKVAVVSAAAVLLWFGLYRFAHLGFSLLATFGSELLGGAELRLGDVVMGRLLSFFALALLVMLVFSNLVIAYQTFFRAPEMRRLMASPLPTATLFLGRFSECLTLSSWASAYLGSPILLAYGHASAAPAVFYLSLVAFFVPFVAIPAAIGATGAITIVRFAPRLRPGPWSLAGVPLAVLLFVTFRHSFRLPDLSQTAELHGVLEAIGRTQSPWLPSGWLARGVLGAATGDYGLAATQLGLLVAVAAAAVGLAILVARAWLADGYSHALAGGQAARGWDPLRYLDRLLAPLPTVERALFIKDLKLFWRDPSQWTQFVLLFGLMALYLINLRRGVAVGDQELWNVWGTLLNLGAALLILASLTTRFIFPLISLEGRRFWLLGLAPLSRRRLLAQKLALALATTAPFTLGLTWLSGHRLQLDGAALGLSIGGAAATTVALCSLAVGLGSLYADFTLDNPARIVSGLGGTLNFLLSLIFVTGLVAAQAVLLIAHTETAWGALLAGIWSWLAVAWIVASTLFTAVVPLALGWSRLRRVEV